MAAAAMTCLFYFAADAGQAIEVHLERTRPLSRFSAAQLKVLAKLNHADSAHLGRLGRMVVPNRWADDELLYSPMPRTVPELTNERKAIIVDIPAQVFGAYENGELVRWGPVSTGDRQHQTVAGTYHLNWHTRVRVSSENPTWIMPWYFNFSSDRGYGLHEYTLPGRPASHGCTRLLETDAKWFFHWGEDWTLDEDRQMVQPGTLLLLIGTYNFRAPQPWLRPGWWTRGVIVSIDDKIASRK
jgi:hypothetical protein